MSSSEISSNESLGDDESSMEDDESKEVDWVETPGQSDANEGQTDMVVDTPPPPKSVYELQREARIRRNTERLQALGLIGRVSFADPSTPDPRLSTTHQRSSKRQQPSSVPVSTRKSPRILAQQANATVDLTETTATSRERVNQEPQSTSNQNETTTQSVGRSVMIRRRGINAKVAVKVGKARKKLLVVAEGTHVMHPMTLKSEDSPIKIIKGAIKEESRDSFLTLCDAYIKYHADLGRCFSYNRKGYQTQCSCLNSLVTLGDNSLQKIKQVTESMYAFFVRPKLTQKLVFREWIRSASTLKQVNKVSCYKVSTHFTLSGVYEDVPRNNKPFQVCKNTLMRIHNYSYFKFNKLQEQIESPSLIPHGLCNRVSNRMIHNQERFKNIDVSLKIFFEGLKDEAETHATRVVREVSGVTLRDEEVDTVELPSSFSKRQVYSRYCFQRGWVVRADAKGCLPKLKDYQRRPFNDLDWPVGSEAKPVPSRIYFDQYWKSHFPLMKIRNPSADT